MKRFIFINWKTMTMRFGKVFIFIGTIFTLFYCTEKMPSRLLTPHEDFINQITTDESSFYFITKNSAKEKSDLAIGIFDSGIGGMTVFEAIVNADFYDSNGNKQPDGENDFAGEQFIYLADDANMPYSNYVETGKTNLLEEHILKDALFLINNKYHPSPNQLIVANNKPQVKAIVIACNTATAYGKPHVEELCKRADLDIKIVGVIDAGCKGALEAAGEKSNGAIAVFATPATVSSMAYVETLKSMNKQNKGRITIVQQGGKGLHESIENKPGFINKKAKRFYSEYQGPSSFNEQYKINKELLDYYNFDTTDNRMLFNHQKLENADTIAINSVENYVRYHIVSLLETLKQEKDSFPLRSVILGCTHYPLVSGTIGKVLNELKPTDRYSYLLKDSCHLIDPALNTAKELYDHFSQNKLFNQSGEKRVNESQFYITVPNVFNSDVEVGKDARFTYEFQYLKREAGMLKDYTLIVPFSKKLISEEQMNLIEYNLPFTYNLLN